MDVKDEKLGANDSQHFGCFDLVAISRIYIDCYFLPCDVLI